MRFISRETKDAIVKKAIENRGVNLKEFAAQNNIGYSTLNKWLSKYRSGEVQERSRPTRSNKQLTYTERLQHVLASASLDEQAISVYCREHGLYAVQLTEWKHQMMTEKKDEKNNVGLLNELKTLRTEVKQLKKELHRKDRALSETAALLVLKKKAHAIWGEPEEG